MSQYIPVLEFDQIKPGTMRHVDVKDLSIVIIREGDQIFAFEDRCTHEDFPLSDGWIDDGCLYCAMHGAKFDLKTGEALSMPAYENAQTFETRITKNMIEINIEQGR